MTWKRIAAALLKLCEKASWIENEITETHIVPATLVEIWVSSSSSSFAMPKSDILAFMFPSRRTLVVFMSLWTILSVDSSCRKARPFAISTQIFCLVGQSRFSWPSFLPVISMHSPTNQIFYLNSFYMPFNVLLFLKSIYKSYYFKEMSIAYRTKHAQGYCFPCIHKPVVVASHWCNIHTI